MTGWIEGSPGVRGAVPPSAGPPRRIRRQFIAVDDQGSRYQLGELLLDVIAARLLTVAATYPQDTLEQLAAAKPGLVPHAAAGLCARLGVSGHGITARPADDLPGPWLSMLTRYHRRTPQPAPASGRSVATAVELPELDGARFAILGLHHSDGAAMFHLQASGVTPEDDWEYIRSVRPLPVLWIRDSSGRWHTTPPGPTCSPSANPRSSAPANPSTGPEIRARTNRPSRRWPT